MAATEQSLLALLENCPPVYRVTTIDGHLALQTTNGQGSGCHFLTDGQRGAPGHRTVSPSQEGVRRDRLVPVYGASYLILVRDEFSDDPTPDNQGDHLLREVDMIILAYGADLELVHSVLKAFVDAGPPASD